MFKEPVFFDAVEISTECKNMIKAFLNKDPKKRLGSQNDFMEVRTHPFFSDINYDDLLKYKIEAPYVPDLKSESDVEFFDPKYTEQRPKITILSKEMVSKFKNYDHMFQGFYYDDILDKDDWKVIQEETDTPTDSNTNTEEISEKEDPITEDVPTSKPGGDEEEEKEKDDSQPTTNNN